eukprot:SAG31_NODE_10044_length_1192_cov_1.033852_3_plen_139_part_01
MPVAFAPKDGPQVHYMVATMSPVDAVGENVWETRRFGGDKEAAMKYFTSPINSLPHCSHLLFKVLRVRSGEMRHGKYSWVVEKIDKYGRPGAESKLMVAARWEAEKLEMKELGWRSPARSEEGKLLVGRRVWVMRKGAG